MSVALRIVAICAALCAGVLLALMVAFGGPNYYGLRPHAVKVDMETHDLSHLVSLAEYGKVSSILSYDAWYKGRDGKTGWFLLPVDQTEGIKFNVNGQLNPTYATVFGASPRRCNGTSQPEKMVRGIEPERTQLGFLGCSTCRRSKMEIREVIAASAPAIRHSEKMTFEELIQFDAIGDPLVQRDNVTVWPTPYAYHRTLSLPVVWQSLDARPDFTISDFRSIASDLADTFTREGVIGVRLQKQEWYPRHVTEALPNHLPFRTQNKTVMLDGIKFVRFDFVVLCAPSALTDCDAVDVSVLIDDVQKLRDRSVLNAALDRQTPLPEGNMVLRDVLSENAIQRDGLIAPTSKERRFPITWYDARPTSASK